MQRLPADGSANSNEQSASPSTASTRLALPCMWQRKRADYADVPLCGISDAGDQVNCAWCALLGAGWVLAALYAIKWFLAWTI